MKLLNTSAIVLVMAGTAPAMAGDQTDIDQVLFNLQTALNTLTNVHNNTNVSQSAVNAGNLITVEDDQLDDVTQFAMTAQLAANSAYTVYGGYKNLDQTATNVVNSLSMTEVDATDAVVSDIIQVSLFTPQVAYNEVGYNQSLDTVAQGAVNAANLVSVEDITEGVAQLWLGGLQVSGNLAYGGGDSSFVTGLDQSATNVANSISADDIDVSSKYAIEALQEAVGVQLAGNVVEFNDGCGNGAGSCSDPSTIALNASSQTALNAANLLTLDELRGVASQDAAVFQASYNGAYFSGPGNQWNHGEIADLDQAATNAANIISANEVASISGSLEISQLSTSVQIAANDVFGQGGINGLTQSATNVANSISIGVTPDL